MNQTHAMNPSRAVVRYDTMHVADTPNGADRVAKTFWRYGWGLVFVVAMTLLSVYATALGSTKPMPPGIPAISESAGHSVK